MEYDIIITNWGDVRSWIIWGASDWRRRWKAKASEDERRRHRGPGNRRQSVEERRIKHAECMRKKRRTYPYYRRKEVLLRRIKRNRKECIHRPADIIARGIAADHLSRNIIIETVPVKFVTEASGKKRHAIVEVASFTSYIRHQSCRPKSLKVNSSTINTPRRNRKRSRCPRTEWCKNTICQTADFKRPWRWTWQWTKFL